MKLITQCLLLICVLFASVSQQTFAHDQQSQWLDSSFAAEYVVVVECDTKTAPENDTEQYDFLCASHFTFAQRIDVLNRIIQWPLSFEQTRHASIRAPPAPLSI